MTVLLVAAKRELIDHKIALLSEVGVDPSVIDVDSFALHNAFEFNHPDAMRGTVALVNIGNDVCNVSVLDDGIPILTRFMRVLEGSPFLENVMINKSNAMLIDGREVTEFTLDVHYQKPDPAAVTTVPITLSVR